ncbi:diaminobutyrate--2-oxoglutarate transaminase [Nitriliruptor alkaliphilus]|uniref:diaminobutyrate--2-oxoglutarate transaminase n=1 Tax=Nitriliruptor alkaliphilus TaxID=427918 RepID=UPI000696ACF2|nr:diaminobutyrate--2-oxoglutarate transaminase [Nitriliruptor alkaliphilus]
MDTVNRLESEVRSYCRAWPTTFTTARGSWLTDEAGTRYLDLFAGAGALNYGHNDPDIKAALLDYLSTDTIVHGLDMSTTAKRSFLETFEQVILRPRGMDHRVMFPGPTGTNAVEAALKLARKVTGRTNVVCFTNAFHGMTLGSLAVTGDSMKRGGANVPLSHTHRMPFDDYFRTGVDTIDYLEAYLDDAGSGVALPAAVILETVQGEGGLRVASDAWLQRLSALCREHGILLIVDDIQAGCGRTGTFFSFEPSGIVPDIITLSKSLSGLGLPFAVTLMRPELDVWEPGEHNGTFRGFNPAFVTATAALERWRDGAFASEVRRKAELVTTGLQGLADRMPAGEARVVGRGFMQGVELDTPGLATAVAREAFARQVLVETAGADDQVVKLLPPLTISEAELAHAFAVLSDALDAARSQHEVTPDAAPALLSA